MYSTCLFCHSGLGRNDSLEHFSVARRVAYDPVRGRVWAVCRRCERWNLSPLETRWEAIEEAERAFRGTPLRVSTENIGLARLRGGLELVRIGTPPRLELAGWRYGDQFGRRRRKHFAVVTVGAAATLLPGAPFIGLAVVGAGATLAHVGSDLWRTWRDNQEVKFVIRDEDGATLGLTRRDTQGATLIPVPEVSGWKLRLPYHRRRVAGGAWVTSKHSFAAGDQEKRYLHDDVAMRALAMMLPHINRSGAGARQVRAAVDVLGSLANREQLLLTAAVNTEARRTHYKVKDGESNVGALPARFRFAMEMALHEDAEQRALEGELAELEARWRDAETIAKIADELLMPSEVDARLEHIKRRDVNEPG